MVGVFWLFACSGGTVETPEPEPAPARVAPPRPEPMRAPLEAPRPAAIDLSTAAPRVIDAVTREGDPVDGIAVLFSSRGEGDIEPCGCPRQPAGGLSRRRVAIEAERATLPAILVEGGDSLAKDAARKGPPSGQERAKARLIAEQWVASGLDAAALGAADWGLGRGFVEDLVKEGYPALAANLVCEGGARPFPAGRIVEVGGRRVGVVGLTAGEVEGCVVTDPLEAAREVAAGLASEGLDATILLWPAREDEVVFAAREGLPFDFVLDASGRISNEVAQREGSIWVLGSGQQTKSLGALTLRFTGEPKDGFRPSFFPPDHDKRLTERERRAQNQLEHRGNRASTAGDERTRQAWEAQRQLYQAELDGLKAERAQLQSGVHHQMAVKTRLLTADVGEHAETAKAVADVKATFSDLADASGAEIIARPMVAPPGSAYAGTAACVSCHPTQYNQWRGTGHSRAISALVAADRHMDEECWSCHVTGAQPASAGGFPVVLADATTVGGLLNVQCEACHGPAAAHTKDPAKHRTVKAPAQAVCVGCHDGQRDGGRFDFASYLARVTHPDAP